MPKALKKVAADEDVNILDGAQLTKEKARQVEEEARRAPRAGSPLNHMFIYNLARIPNDSVGPLLKAVEEAKFTRFIFQTQVRTRGLNTLASRSTVILLPFLSRKVVLGNMTVMNLDAKTADEQGLYDGTLSGTIKALNMRETAGALKREAGRGVRGLAYLYTQEALDSIAFDPVMAQVMDKKEQAFLRRNKTRARQKVALYVAMSRGSK